VNVWSGYLWLFGRLRRHLPFRDDRVIEEHNRLGIFSLNVIMKLNLFTLEFKCLRLSCFQLLGRFPTIIRRCFSVLLALGKLL